MSECRDCADREDTCPACRQQAKGAFARLAETAEKLARSVEQVAREAEKLKRSAVRAEERANRRPERPFYATVPRQRRSLRPRHQGRGRR